MSTKTIRSSPSGPKVDVLTGLTSANAGTNITITGTETEPVINASGGSGGGTVNEVTATDLVVTNATGPVVDIDASAIANAAAAAQSTATTANAAAATAQSTADSKVASVNAGTNITISGTPTAPIINASGGGGSAAGGIQVFDLALADTQNAPWVGAGGSFGNLYLAAVPTGPGTAALNSVNVLCTQTGSTAGGLSAGIYNQAGLRLACTSIISPTVGLVNLPLTIGAGIVLPPSSAVYLGVFSNTNGARVAGVGGRLTGTPAVSLGVLVPNATSLPGGASTGCPTNIGAFLSTQTQLRYWAGFSI